MAGQQRPYENSCYVNPVGIVKIRASHFHVPIYSLASLSLWYYINDTAPVGNLLRFHLITFYLILSYQHHSKYKI